jgi:hypothetical protein
MSIAAARPVFNIDYNGESQLRFSTIEGMTLTAHGSMDYFDLYISPKSNVAIPFGVFSGEIQIDDRLIQFDIHFKDNSGVITERATSPDLPLVLLRANLSIAVFRNTMTGEKMVLVNEPGALWDIERKLFCGRDGCRLLFIQIS